MIYKYIKVENNFLHFCKLNIDMKLLLIFGFNFATSVTFKTRCTVFKTSGVMWDKNVTK